MDGANPYDAWPHHCIPKRMQEEMERAHRESTDATLRRPTPFYLAGSSPSSAGSTPPHPRRSHPQTSNLHLPPLRNRYAGDGLDFRRPAMSTPAAAAAGPPPVIDLTSEDEPFLPEASARSIAPQMQSTRASRPPRFPREIIDLSTEDTPPRAPMAPVPSSPEIEFVSARTIPGRRPQATDVDLTITDDDFELPMFGDLGASRQGVNRGQPHNAGFLTRTQRHNELMNRRIRQLFDGILEIQMHTPPPVANFMGPGDLNYAAVAFDLGGERDPTPPTYDAPPDAPAGFTRSPAQDDVLLCPNCDAELCAGPEGGDKKQVWIIKACGHAYCGECARNRHASKRKGKEPAGSHGAGRLPQPFHKCVVKDCGKKCMARTAMIQLFL